MKQLKLIIVFILLLGFFAGCTHPSGFNHFDKDILYKRAMHYTKKADIAGKSKVKVLFKATYLNSIDENWNDEFENFIISVYTVDDPKLDDFTITLNGINAYKITDFDQEHQMYGNLPLYNAWAKYKIYKFENPDHNPILNLKLIHPCGKNATLQFEAE